MGATMGNGHTIDRRRHARRTVNVPVFAKWGDGIRNLELRSVSWGGGFLCGADLPEPGTRILVAPRNLGKRPPVLSAQVRYLLGKPGESERGVGLVWILPAESVRRRIVGDFLEQLIRTGQVRAEAEMAPAPAAQTTAAVHAAAPRPVGDRGFRRPVMRLGEALRQSGVSADGASGPYAGAPQSYSRESYRTDDRRAARSERRRESDGSDKTSFFRDRIPARALQGQAFGELLRSLSGDSTV